MTQLSETKALLQKKARQRCHWLPTLDKSSGVLYLSLVNQLAADIANGTLKAGDTLPPQRLLADALQITLGTVTRAYREAERRGLTEAKVGSGTRIRGQQVDLPNFHHLSKALADSIDLSLSTPIPSALRGEQLRQILLRLSSNHAETENAIVYQPEQGNLAHRQRLARWMNAQGLRVDAQELLLTEGGQHADYLALQTFVRPGEAVASANITYPGMIAAAKQLGLKHINVSSDAQGIRPESLDRICQQQKIRLLYLMAEYNNPSCEMMSEARRIDLVEVARRHDLLILEDGVQFVPPSHRGTPFFELAPERSLYIFSVSKILDGGLRFGALRAPSPLMPKLSSALRAQCWGIAGLMGSVICEWIDMGGADQLIEWQWQEVKHRQQHLRQLFKDYDLRSHEFGFHAWLNLPEDWRASQFVEEAKQRGVTLIGPEPFCVGSYPAPQSVRICVTPPRDFSTFAEGVARLKHLLEQGPSMSTALI